MLGWKLIHVSERGPCTKMVKSLFKGLFSIRHGWWWRYQMEAFSALLARCAGNSPATGEFPHKGQWRGALMLYLICAWINGWVSNHEAGDLIHHRARYDATVMLGVEKLKISYNKEDLINWRLYPSPGRHESIYHIKPLYEPAWGYEIWQDVNMMWT